MTENKKIEKINFTTVPPDDEYYQCSFENCDFSNLVIANTYFDECSFKHCNFTLAKFTNNLREVTFTECKLTGTDFSGISKFSQSFRFEKSHMQYASFMGIKMKNAYFDNCIIHEAYFEDTNLTSSVFHQCDLERASFFNTNLEKVDFSTSFNFTINPSVNKLKKAIFAESELKGLVAHLNIVIV